MKFVLDLRWVRSAHVDGIGRVSLSLAAELLRLKTAHCWGLLFSSPERARFALDWIRCYDNRPLTATYRADILRCEAHSPLNIFQLERIRRLFQPDLYFTPYFPFFVCIGLPCVGMVHDLIPLRYPEYFCHASLPFRLLMTHARLLRLLLRPCQRIVTVSHSSARDLQALLGLPLEQIHVIYPGVQRFIPHPNPTAILTRYSLPVAGDYILAVGRPEVYKNFQGLIRSYARLPHALRQRHPLVLVGPHHPHQTPVLESLVISRGLRAFVYFSGAVATEDLPAIYQQARVFVMPSLYEGFGLPVLEAMVAGIPVLCSDRASLPEVAGSAALFHDPEDEMGWAQQLERILTDPALRHSLIQAGRARVEFFSWQRMAQELLCLLEAMVHQVQG